MRRCVVVRTVPVVKALWILWIHIPDIYCPPSKSGPGDRSLQIAACTLVNRSIHPSARLRRVASDFLFPLQGRDVVLCMCRFPTRRNLHLIPGSEQPTFRDPDIFAFDKSIVASEDLDSRPPLPPPFLFEHTRMHGSMLRSMRPKLCLIDGKRTYASHVGTQEVFHVQRGFASQGRLDWLTAMMSFYLSRAFRKPAQSSLSWPPGSSCSPCSSCSFTPLPIRATHSKEMQSQDLLSGCTLLMNQQNIKHSLGPAF